MYFLLSSQNLLTTQFFTYLYEVLRLKSEVLSSTQGEKYKTLTLNEHYFIKFCIFRRWFLLNADSRKRGMCFCQSEYIPSSWLLTEIWSDTPTVSAGSSSSGWHLVAFLRLYFLCVSLCHSFCLPSKCCSRWFGKSRNKSFLVYMILLLANDCLLSLLDQIRSF